MLAGNPLLLPCAAAAAVLVAGGSLLVGLVLAARPGCSTLQVGYRVPRVPLTLLSVPRQKSAF